MSTTTNTHDVAQRLAEAGLVVTVRHYKSEVSGKRYAAAQGLTLARRHDGRGWVGVRPVKALDVAYSAHGMPYEHEFQADSLNRYAVVRDGVTLPNAEAYAAAYVVAIGCEPGAGLRAVAQALDALNDEAEAVLSAEAADEAQPVAVVASDEWAAEDIAPTFYYASGAEATMCDHAEAWANADGNLYCETCGATAYVSTAQPDERHNGWANWETWRVVGALDNVPALYDGAWSIIGHHDRLNREGWVLEPLAESLERLVAERGGDEVTGVDLARVNWDEVAREWGAADEAEPEPEDDERPQPAYMHSVGGVAWVSATRDGELSHHIGQDLTVRLVKREGRWTFAVDVYGAPGRLVGSREHHEDWATQEGAVSGAREHLRRWYDLAL